VFGQKSSALQAFWLGPVVLLVAVGCNHHHPWEAARKVFPDLLKQFHNAHAGHVDVGEDEGSSPAFQSALRLPMELANARLLYSLLSLYELSVSRGCTSFRHLLPLFAWPWFK